ncbi:MAG TPA: AbrB/MazE/SpoVT family DNA-binding domain-containing protein [Gammaproteobacteria bacterium]|nr:AbrB/MazE/SpoVT family DNA-binding domain-containing protein [Gammaproteobacteria bacterium]
MKTVSIFNNGNNRAIRLPKDMEFPGVNELEITQIGNSVVLRPVRPDWSSFAECEKADPDFLEDREDVVSDEGRVNP